MDALSLCWLAEAVGADPEQFLKDRPIVGVSTDSRATKPGEVFFALPGPRSDGRRYVVEAFARGAAAAVVEEGGGPIAGAGQVIEVPDVLRALGALGAAYRDTLPGTVIAITGSVGKTTTKDMIHAAFEGSRRVVKAPRSFNNFIGVPLTLLSASREDEVIICELGTNAPGEIDRLGAIVRPDVSVLTGIGLSHLQGLHDIEGVAAEKVALLRHLKRGGAAFFNGDDVRTRAMAAVFRELRPEDVALTVGFAADCDWRGMPLELMTSEPEARSRMRIDGGRFLELGVPGLHNLRNAFLAFAVAAEAGIEAPEILSRLARFQTPAGRLDVIRSGPVTLIDDSYNANPTSMRAALECFSLFAAGEKRIAVLGSMLELGPRSKGFHRQVGRLVVRYGIDTLITVGDDAAQIAEAARSLGMPSQRIRVFDTAAEALAAPIWEPEPGQSYLIKGSRAVGLDAVVQDLCRRAQPAEATLLSVA